MIFSWQVPQWEQLRRLHREARLPHALLFMGPEGVGKRHLARILAGLVLCQQPDITAGQACGHCHACHLMQADSHPDFALVQPEEEGHAIKIDQIRELSEFIQKTSHQGGFQVVIIQPATAMNTYTANALLKTLEEPSPQTLIILISDKRSELPVTITSRCQQIRFSRPSQATSLSWLQAQDSTVDWEPILEATQGSPLLSQMWQQQGIWAQYQNFMRDLNALSQQTVDPLQLALQWKDANMLWIFDMFFHWLQKLLRMQLEPTQENISSNEGFSSASLFEFIDYLKQMRAEVSGPYNLNQQLMLESLFIRWVQYVSR